MTDSRNSKPSRAIERWSSGGMMKQLLLEHVVPIVIHERGLEACEAAWKTPAWWKG